MATSEHQSTMTSTHGGESFATTVEGVTGTEFPSVPLVRRDGHGVYVTDLSEQFRAYLGERLIVIEDDDSIQAVHIDESSERTTDHGVPGLVNLYVGWQQMVRNESPTRVECEDFDVLVEDASAPMPVLHGGEVWWVSHRCVPDSDRPTIDWL